MKKSILLTIELLLIFIAGHYAKTEQTLLFLGTPFIYLMSGGLLFYSLFLEEMTLRKMLRKQGRRWALLLLLIGFKVPLWLLFSFLFLFVFRGTLFCILWLCKKKGWGLRRIAILGKAALPESIFWTGYRLVARDPDLSKLEELGIEELWISFPISEQKKVVPILASLKESTLDIKLLPNLEEIAPLNSGISTIGNKVAIHVQQTPMQGINRLLKELEDKLLAAMILVFVSPLMLLVALLVKLSSPGPIFYKQERVSWNNEVFSMLKFRTMPLSAEASTGPVWAKAGDCRTTWVGKWLRRTCIDELPQFFNVLRGEMSIVGPRPERPHFIAQFKEEIPRYMQKHMVKAGITGLAQIRGFRGQTDLSRRIEYDLQYLRDWSLWLDFKIIFLTFFKGLKNAY